MSRAGLLWGWEKRESGEKAELSTESTESSCSQTLPSVFLTHRYFPLLSTVSKKINKLGVAGRQGDKDGRTGADSFCLPHLRREALSGFLLQIGIRWDHSGSNSICFSRKSSLRQRAQDLPGRLTKHRSIINVFYRWLYQGGERAVTVFLGRTTTGVPHSSSEGIEARGCKNPFKKKKQPRFCRNAVQHYRIVGIFL